MEGQVIGNFTVVKLIGHGGMGEVYLAEQKDLGTRVAIKLLQTGVSRDRDHVTRFFNEARAVGKINHAGIVRIFDAGYTAAGRAYFVMEMLEGDDLANELARDGTLALTRAADILAQCCRALAAAHAKGIVHRDMKPENVFLTSRDGRPDFVKIVDFGIAKMSDIETTGAPGRKLTKTGMIFGTPEYMSPEQAAGKASLDHRVDIYALGVIFYELITGRVPFVGDTFMGVLTQHMFEPVPALTETNPNVKVSPAIEAFIGRALSKDPDDRFQSCDEMYSALEDAMGGDVAPDAVGQRTFQRGGGPTTGKLRGLRAEAVTQEYNPNAGGGRGLWIALALAIVLGGGGAGIWYAMGGAAAAGDGGHDGPPITTVSTAAEDAAIDAWVASASVAQDAAVVAPAVDAGPLRVSIHVETTPSGARLSVEDRGEVCEETPCDFDAPAGQEITLHASLRRARGETHLIPIEGMAPVSIRLVAHAPSATGTGGDDTVHGTGPGDLKTPDIFLHPRGG